ncbi:MAG: DUF4062 domain-containing protein [Lachnospiraceae bacterium]|nr:DUF4062 domain-containing protein [Lachnospiraceae bacterium]
MEKKYQFFISSTYEDLKVEREKAIFTILSMEQFPVGMELFSAADEDQWDVISQTIDTSDYYVLIIGNRYGSIIPAGSPDAGISYTEKEFNYAVSKHIPVLAFILDEAVAASIPSGEPSEACAKLREFKDKAKTGRYIKYFKNADQLSALLSQSIHKALQRGDRPGWVRTTEFDIEDSHAKILRLLDRVHTLEALNADLKLENDRKPNLLITYMRDPEHEDEDGHPYGNEPEIKDGIIYFKVKSVYLDDVKDGLTYKNAWGKEICVPYNDVRLFRHFFQNGFSLLYHIENNGTARATGVRIHMKIPDGLLVVSNQEIYSYMEEPAVNSSEEEYQGRMKVLFPPDGHEGGEECKGENPFISIDELLVNEDIADLLDPGELELSAGEINLEFAEIKHKDSAFYIGAYLLPTSPGEYEIKCAIMCNELADATVQTIRVIVE